MRYTLLTSWRRFGTVAALTVILITSQSAVANAATPDPTDQLAAAVADVAPDAQVVAPDSEGTALTADTSTGSVEMPSTADAPVVVQADQGFPISIALPDAAQGAARVADDGTVVYSDTPGSGVTVQATETGARISAVLPDAAAGTDLNYTFDGLTPTLNTDGSVSLTYESDGISVDVGLISSPWALDADGKAVPTSYVIHGSTVSQVVDLSEQDLSFPVVADPAIQHDCGIITCTIRFDRNTTNNIAAGTGAAGIVVGLTTLSGGTLAPVAGVVAAKLGLSAIFAGWALNRGNCSGYRFPVTNWLNPMSWADIEVKNGTYNCR